MVHTLMTQGPHLHDSWLMTYDMTHGSWVMTYDMTYEGQDSGNQTTTSTVAVLVLVVVVRIILTICLEHGPRHPICYIKLADQRLAIGHQL